MKKMAVLGIAATFLLSAGPTEAAVKKVNAALNAVAWDAVDVDDGVIRAYCDVNIVDTGDDPHVRLTCFGTEGYGKAWVRVKVPGVKGKVTRVRAATSAFCSGKKVTWKKRPNRVLVTVSVRAGSNCDVGTISVRST